MEALKNDGGPAFPCETFDTVLFAELRQTEGIYEARKMATGAHGGMTLRDHFAAQALPDVLAKTYRECAERQIQADVAVVSAIFAYEVADAMLAARAAVSLEDLL